MIIIRILIVVLLVLIGIVAVIIALPFYIYQEISFKIYLWWHFDEIMEGIERRM